jgi:hypothetical protein
VAPDGHHWVELDARSSSGLEVTLLWRPADGATAVSVHDRTIGRCVAATVPAVSAADAFRHPFAYLERPTPVGLPPLRLRGEGSSASRPPAVDELWLAELAEEALASLEELLARQRRGEGWHEGHDL